MRMNLETFTFIVATVVVDIFTVRSICVLPYNPHISFSSTRDGRRRSEQPVRQRLGRRADRAGLFDSLVCPRRPPWLLGPGKVEEERAKVGDRGAASRLSS